MQNNKPLAIEWIMVKQSHYMPYGSMNQAHWPLVTDELVEFEEWPIEVQKLQENNQSL